MVFISYSSKDKAQAECVRSVLQANGVVCWMAPESIPYGSDYMKEIPNALNICDVVLVLVSSNAQKSIWVPKEVEKAISSSKVILPLKIENVSLNDKFSLFFENIQMIDTCGNLEEDCVKLIPIIRKAEITTQNVIFETSFSNKKDKGKLLIRSPKSKSESETAVFLFTEEIWNEFFDYVKQITAILNNSNREMVTIQTSRDFGEYQCAPMDNRPYWNGPGRMTFSVKDINYTQNKNIKNFYFELNREKVELKIFFCGEVPESKELSYFGIDEEAFLKVVKKFIRFSNSVSDVIIGENLNYKCTTNTSVEYELLFGYGK